MSLPTSQYIVYDNGSEFKLHFETLCDSYGLKHKPTSVKNPQANAILERVHQTIMGMLRTAEIDMADTVSESDIADFLTNAAWAVRSTYHMVLKASPGAAIFGREMLFGIPFIDTKLIATQDVKTRHVLIGITKLAIKYLCIKIVFSTKQRADMTQQVL